MSDTANPRSETSLTLHEIQADVHRYISQFKEGYWHPLSSLARLTEEVGELAREINHRFGQKKKRRDEPEGDLGLEIADVLFILVSIANSQQIDLDVCFRDVMHKYGIRDHHRFERIDSTQTLESSAAATPAPKDA